MRSELTPDSVGSRAENESLMGVTSIAGTIGGAGTHADQFARIARATQQDSPLLAGIYLRERDLTCFRFDMGVPDQKAKDRTEIRCLLFEGEIPCLYFVRLVVTRENCMQISPVCAGITSTFLSMVDFVAHTTGGGIGIALQESPQSQLATDVSTGRRVRYKISKFADADPGPESVPASDQFQKVYPEDVYWVERSETGRNRGSPRGSMASFI